MKLFNIGAVLVAILFGLCGYWYLNPDKAPAFLRGKLPQVELRGPSVGYP